MFDDGGECKDGTIVKVGVIVLCKIEMCRELGLDYYDVLVWMARIMLLAKKVNGSMEMDGDIVKQLMVIL